MKALILNSGLGSRMGALTSEHPKCMTEISSRQTILSRQLTQIADAGITEVVITTGYYDEVLVDYCKSLDLPLNFTYVKNLIYDKTNYIYSIYCAREYLQDDIILMHGDLVFENEVFDKVLASESSCMTVSSTLPLPEKDFKAQIRDGMVMKVGVDIFEDALEAQALYKLNREDWKVWLDEISAFCEAGNTKVYAENALNELNGAANIAALDVGDLLCAEIDTPEDLAVVSARLKKIENRTVYMCFATDIIHGGHIAIIRKARRLGKLIIGVLSDEAVASYKRFPLLPAVERMRLFENIAGVSRVVEQRTLSYRENLEKYYPDIVVHGDDWCTGFQKPIRDEVVSILESYGGKLVEFPYSRDEKYKELQRRERAELAMPDIRRGRLKRVLDTKGLVTVMEAHDGLTGLIVENTVVHENGGAHQFDAMWVSSLCDSTAKGKPDIELVDMTSRFRTIDDIMEVTTKPIIFDGDTGGLTEHFVYTVRTLERMGVSMIIIEDKTGLKKNSLFGTEVVQMQDSIENFSAKIRAGKKAQRTKEFMICARIESLILERGMEDALTRAFAFAEAGADAIMIHSRKKDPSEIQEFIEKFRAKDSTTPIVLVPTSFNSVTEEEWKARGANIIIYANQLMRAEVPAMQKAAETILKNHRAEECDAMLMPFKEIIRLIPEE
ncbi:phosphoenolpyruvate mutase [Aristaeella hokkaidonensis]|uniref:Phosphoenolpyruvate mutase n=1 Tax=Aristaeella hokkaidonensis TaxID=3046382 RepID=A0AC61N6E4_9FIRM|nr:phosphoenolpyruvate mutase [Aristaeella hokkaidonensis]QUC66663.1 phosphoenolpyruvate mutase [Aristaeella hokkaidonensis]SNT94636.1 phosphoenolpyruvate mutase [Aristaeella hokkaidonensis]